MNCPKCKNDKWVQLKVTVWGYSWADAKTMQIDEPPDYVEMYDDGRDVDEACCVECDYTFPVSVQIIGSKIIYTPENGGIT